MSREVEYLLCQWALWSRSNSGKPSGYPCRAAFANSFRDCDLRITDDEAMVVDSIMSKTQTER